MSVTINVTFLKEGCGCCKATVLLTDSPNLVIMVPRWQGLGDLVKDVIKYTLRIKPCAACDRRRKWLNDRFPFIGPVLRGMIASTKEDSYPLTLTVGELVYNAYRKELSDEKANKE